MIGAATWLVAGGLREPANNLGLGRLSDCASARSRRSGSRSSPPSSSWSCWAWPDERFARAAVVVLAGLAFGTFYTPGMTLLTQAAEDRGLDYGYAFALVNLAWAPGQTAGSALGGALAEQTSDAVPYLGLAVISLLTFAALWRFASSS